jgi:hypothetical protein
MKNAAAWLQSARGCRVSGVALFLPSGSED